MAYKQNGYRGNRTNSFNEISGLTGGESDPVKSDLTRKEKRGIRKAQRKNKSTKVSEELYKAGVIAVGPSTPFIEVKDSQAPPGTGTGYNIDAGASFSVAPMPGTTGPEVTTTIVPRTPPPSTKPDPDPKPRPIKFSDGKIKAPTSKAPRRSKYLKTGLFSGKGFLNKGYRGTKRGISGKRW
jgi:hypothetical protein